MNEAREESQSIKRGCVIWNMLLCVDGVADYLGISRRSVALPSSRHSVTTPRLATSERLGRLQM